MPTADTPAAGVGIVASGQVLNRRVFLIHGPDGFDQFGITDNDILAISIKATCLTQINNLSRVFISLFLFPYYNTGARVYRARNYIEWRPVFRMPPMSFPNPNPVDTTLTVIDDWLPLTSPMILPVAAPITFEMDCCGIEQASIEVRVRSDYVAARDQGIDRVAFSLSGTQ